MKKGVNDMRRRKETAGVKAPPLRNDGIGSTRAAIAAAAKRLAANEPVEFKYGGRKKNGRRKP